MTKILFILRGRPGLGHVIPGLSLAQEAKKRGCEVFIITYDNGAKFLKKSKEVSLQWEEITITPKYYDWPGLNIYDDGLGIITAKIQEINPNLVILGGEYQLGLLASMFKNIQFAMIFNPEIFELSPRNDRSARLFAKFFEDCCYLIPLTKLQNKPYYDLLNRFKSKILSGGPFTFTSSQITPLPKKGLLILLANGGGVSFPKCAISYSSGSEDITRLWLEQTEQMTKETLQISLQYMNKEDTLFLFSCLPNHKNVLLKKEFRDYPNVNILSPSNEYYKVLHNANLIISRAGAGFITDVNSVLANAILWPLQQHDEQMQNAYELCKTRANTFVSVTRDDLKKLIEENFKSLKNNVMERDCVQKMDYYKNTISVISEILEKTH